jgi:hypothetical protein
MMRKLLIPNVLYVSNRHRKTYMEEISLSQASTKLTGQHL